MVNTYVGPQPLPTVRDPGPEAGWCIPLSMGMEPGSPLLLSLQEVDWEVELAVIIGRKGKHIKVRWKRSCQWSVALGNG